MRILWQDIRYALRMIGRSPGFAVMVILILAVGIGANTAVFSIVNTVLLKALSYDDPGRIVDLEERRENWRPAHRPTSFRTLTYWREYNQVFDHIAGRVGREMHVSGLGEPFRVEATAVSCCFFSLVGVPPRLGRGFLPEEEQLGREHVMIVSHAFWRERLAGDPQVIGKSITADGESYTVVGVMPAGYRDSPSQADVTLWVPLVLDPTAVQGDRTVWAWARLKRGVSVERARANLAVLEKQLAQADPRSYAGYDVSVERLRDRWFWSEQKLLYPLWGAVVLVLLIACMNVAGLFLVHGNARRQEMGVRVSLGASRGRILSQLLTESLLLSLAAGLLGILAAFWMIQGIVAVCPANVSQIEKTHIDRTVLFFTLGLSVFVGLAFGLLPAWKAGGVGPVGTLRQESSGPVTDRSWRRLCHGLVVAQIAIALTLLVGVGMLVQSLILLWREDLGFRPKNVIVVHLEFPVTKYPEGNRAAVFLNQLLQQVQTLPGVCSAAVISPDLYLGPWGGAFGGLSIEGCPPDRENPTLTRVQIVSSDFFATMGMRVLQGRGFTAQDMQGTKRAVIIDERLARRYLPQADPIGQQVGVSGAEILPVVGVVSSLRDYKTLNPDIIAIYWPLSEYCLPRAAFVIKADEDPLRLVGALRAQVAALNEDLKVSSIETLESSLGAMLAPRRFVALLLGVFSQIALVLAALGLYGLLQYSVARRTHEIGIRMALGATPGRIIHTVLRQGGLLILMGVGLGLVGGYAMSRIVASLLYQSKPTDPAMLLATLATLLAVALGACYLPARRAARVDPMVALRYE